MSNKLSRVTLLGLLIWAAALAFLPAPLAARILLLAPLVIVPRLLGLLPDTMIRTHGVLNATAVLLGVAAYHADGS